MRIVIAPDSFKGTISARDAAEALAEGWRAVRASDEIVLRPMADGGEGTLDAFEAAVPGARRMPVTVQGPDDRPADAHWLLLPSVPVPVESARSAGRSRPEREHSRGTGVVELANTSGITLLDPLRPLDAHTLGFGQAIAAALDHGIDRLLLALGGSSSSDGGAGMLAALGGVFLDAAGRPIRLGNRGLGTIARAELSGLRPLPPTEILSDVTNPLLGVSGAAAVFGAQKGATTAQLEAIEANLARFARLLPVDPATPGAGAAGGTGFGLLAAGARMAGGASAVAEAVGLAGALHAASVVITGEGRFDGQSEAGKAPSEVRRLADAAGVPAALVAGLIEAETNGFSASASLTDLAGGSAAAMNDPARWLRAAGERLARGF